MRHVKRGVVVLVAMMVLLCGTVRAQVMQQIPPNALLVLKVNNLKAVNDKLAKLAMDLGVAALAPPVADPLAFLQVQLQMQQGLDLNGELAFVMLDPASVEGAVGPQDSLLILAPVTDYKAFLGNWADAKTEGAVSEIKLAGDTSYVAQWGKYAAIAPGKAAVSTKPTGGLMAPTVTTKELASKDIVLYANMNALRGKLLPDLQQSRAQALQLVEATLARDPQTAKFGAVAKSLVDQLMNVAETYLKESDGATVGLSLVPDGINATVMSEFAPGTYLGKAFGAMKGTDGPLMTGLPSGKYLFYGGSVSDPTVSGPILDDLINPIVKELLAIGPEWAVAKDYADAIKQYIHATKSSTFGMVAPTGAVGTEPLIQLINIQGGDSAAMKDANTKMLAAQGKLMSALNLPGTQGMLPKHTPNAKTIDGVTMDSLVTKVEMDPQNPVAMQQAQIMNIIYGPNGATAYFGTMGDKMVVFSGVKDELISATLAGLKAGGSPLEVDTNVKNVSMQLPKQRLGVVYINLGEIATTGLSYARQFGLALPVMLPPDLPPIGVSVSTEATAIRIDAHIPSILVQSFVAAGLQAQMQMQGGGAAPPPGGGL